MTNKRDESKEELQYDDTNESDDDVSNKKDAGKNETKSKKHEDEVENDGFLVDSGNFAVVLGLRAQKQDSVKRSLPNWLKNPQLIPASIANNKTPFKDFKHILGKPILKTLKANNFFELFPVQSVLLRELLVSSSCLSGICMPGGLPGNDICCSAPTGSGKTLAFVLPIMQMLSTCSLSLVRCLVVVPVVELATQVFKVFQLFSQNTHLKIGLANGLKQFAVEQRSLVGKKRGKYVSKVDVVVCTPGRLVDHLQFTPGFNLSHLRFLVIDEVDRMMDEVQHDWLQLLDRNIANQQPANQLSPLMIDEEEGKGGSSDEMERRIAFMKKKERIKELVTSSPSLSSSLVYDHFSLFGHTDHHHRATVASVQQQPQPHVQKLLFSATLSHNPEKLQLLKLHHPKLFTSVVAVRGKDGVKKGVKDGVKGEMKDGVKGEMKDGMKMVDDGEKKRAKEKKGAKDGEKEKEEVRDVGEKKKDEGIKEKFLKRKLNAKDKEEEEDGEDEAEAGSHGNDDGPPAKKACADGDELNDKSSRNEFLGKYVTPPDLTESFIEADASRKPLLLLHLLKSFQSVVCFTNSVQTAKRLNALMVLMGVGSREFSSSLHIKRRARTIQAFNNHKTSLIIASDAMSRGLDLEHVDCVISYNTPSSFKTYIHRIGRTARAGMAGTAVALLEKKEIFHFKKIMRQSGRPAVKETKVNGCLVEQFKPALQEAFKKLPYVVHQRKNKIVKKKKK